MAPVTTFLAKWRQRHAIRRGIGKPSGGPRRADPSFDIDGVDAAHKLTILLALGFTGEYDLSAVHT